MLISPPLGKRTTLLYAIIWTTALAPTVMVLLNHIDGYPANES